MRHALTAALLATSMFCLPTAARAQAMTAQEARSCARSWRL
jgi:phosphate-selective porin OprO/OprP